MLRSSQSAENEIGFPLVLNSDAGSGPGRAGFVTAPMPRAMYEIGANISYIVYNF